MLFGLPLPGSWNLHQGVEALFSWRSREPARPSFDLVQIALPFKLLKQEGFHGLSNGASLVCFLFPLVFALALGVPSIFLAFAEVCDVLLLLTDLPQLWTCGVLT